MPETDDQLARRLLRKVLDGEEPWTPDMRLRIATVSQAYASLAIVEELRRLNDGRDQWYREVLGVLSAAKSGGVSSLRSEQPAAATVCRVCGKPGFADECTKGPLTGDQWRAHLRFVRDRAPVWAETDTEKHNWAVGPVTKMFGPAPEES